MFISSAIAGHRVCFTMLSGETMEETTCEPTYKGFFIGHNDVITALSFHPNADQLVSSSLDNTVMLWRMKNLMPAYKFMAHKEAVLDVCYSPNGDIMASVSKDRSVRIWIPKVKGYSFDFKAHSSAVRSVQFSPSGEKVILIVYN